jgi:hypothetical protein
MDGSTFFHRLAMLMRDNPPHSDDAPALKRFAAIGLAPGKEFRPPVAVERFLKRLPQEGVLRLAQGLKRLPLKAGWRFPPGNLGNYGTDYQTRAMTALIGLGANRPEDAVYPLAIEDRDGRPLDGARRYLLHFDAGQIPPVRGFWSVTAYTASGYPVRNASGRYAVQGSSGGVRRNDDGSVDIYLQPDPPGEELRNNWVATPAGPFNVALRLYWPERAVLDGLWSPPAIQPMSRPTLGLRAPGQGSGLNSE